MAKNDDKQKQDAEIAAALLLLIRKANHTVHLALLGAATRSKLAALPSAQAEVSDAVEAAVGAARARARAYGAEAFEKQTGKKLPVGRVGSSEEVADSLAEQWGARVEKLEDAESGTVRVAAESGTVRVAAAKDLEWAATRTATTETMQAFNDQSREAFDALFSQGFQLVRVWNSALEINTCQLCMSLHGKHADALGEFPHGDPQLHSQCACWVSVELL